VFAVGRDARRGADLFMALRAAATSGVVTRHRFLRADLASMADTARLADVMASTTDEVDAVVCCAGVFALQPEWTDEGLERTFALNYLSRFLLVRRLDPLLRRSPSARVVLVANAGKYRDRLDLDDPHSRRRRRGLQVAARTQVANDLLAAELAERYRKTSVSATCVFPGFVRTDVFRNGVGVPRPLATLLSAVVDRIGIAPETAADTPAWLAGEADVDHLSAFVLRSAPAAEAHTRTGSSSRTAARVVGAQRAAGCALAGGAAGRPLKPAAPSAAADQRTSSRRLRVGVLMKATSPEPDGVQGQVHRPGPRPPRDGAAPGLPG
jgi:NAD(P)-dependent dehydrogenase (short-subunit alcohol dehydrogenase family)